MLIYVDMEHEQLHNVDPDLWQQSRTALIRNKYRFERLGKRPCLIVRYHQVNFKRLRDLNAEAIFVSGYILDNSYYAAENLAGLMAVYRKWERPLIGFCGGHQLMAQAFGSSIGSMSQLPEVVSQPHLATVQPVSGVEQEIGFQPVTIQQSHPLFHDMTPHPHFFQAHYWEVKDAPPDFEVLASSEHCAVQVMVHRERPLFGTQFHPEAYDDQYGDGRQLIQNFLQLAGIQ
ncbi:MAG: hypothetical protein GY943_27025 [Chloroflexi bacterium]|nr:hypothetical protein [Chloroflexota bacterium]